MSERLRCEIAKRRLKELSHLESAVRSNERVEVRKFEVLAKYLHGRKTLFRAKNSAKFAPLTPWQVGLLIVAFAMFLVAIGASTKISSPAMTFEADVTALTLDTPLNELAFATGQQVNVSSIEVVGTSLPADRLSGITGLALLRAKGGSTLAFKLDNPGCVLITTIGKGSALVLKVIVAASGAAGIPTARQIQVKDGGSVQLCREGMNNIVMTGAISALDVAQVHSNDVPPVMASSIISGTLRIPATAKEFALGPTDRLTFDGIQAGRLFLSIGEGLRIAFSGNVNSPNRVGVSPALDSESLIPSLLDIVISSPEVSALITAVFALVGVLWNVFRRSFSG